MNTSLRIGNISGYLMAMLLAGGLVACTTQEATPDGTGGAMVGTGGAAVGSGGAFAQAAALALLRSTSLDARSIVEQALEIAADICIYTNRNVTIEALG